MNRITVKDIAEYGRTELGTKYRSTAGSQARADPPLVERCLKSL